MLERTRFRQALPRDASDQAEVFHHAIMEGAAGHYTLAQREAWAASLPRTAEAWAARQAIYPTLVAECDGHCIGFCERDMSAGRIETLYVWPSVARQGIGSRLLSLSIEALRDAGRAAVSIEASLVLAPSLSGHGWETLGEEWIERRGERLPRVRMRLAAAASAG
ncbi:MAG: GNAT family N-acetyltransferase [Salinicola sp.]|uniref:GNAT family N-acetyltransferase n=1 Tax=uncultured Salinicola sp. TaxID=1193542 RepID=UPI000C8B00A0|nr:GNAT family N-acetyltransferase [uncultured Salinicola sp.]MAM57093.1 GNAT family N-acetyltransferase [Salinicola sp.]